ncbi:formate dehydrogenase accessory sulfurtransferase FdhD [Saccharolobus solfataricus]|uniref:Sulfur carrier protein FdhD n=2 Tax=Saccharolobus solfataricus TaxID=2287 RepID=A0A0E3GUK3_SACSO|nr:formate dehydrogenase accessory sulfurtransferase FdhD [Saccharolobus solfataricus]AKA73023.1 formate dehydrogenase accessory sulfurtransferase FdhD [Saccharolobus solfataricus]AKA75721.1 formate dehydrogenase accessory sulfurtransferase FdhD [Saccharolobus solfataricus]AKA78413.1 formate dehydrogenase accessory sulfurtransferase FdhD [Saccharolobus solfataricus]AZF69469.1 formate dehydrogenase accessory sulfurtransferase FdhD [Saccharolobus solfataricus]AZF72089.1 formate dehydrogenase acc
MRVKRFDLVRVKDSEAYKDSDFVAVEEPLNIRTCFEKCEDFAIIMRTPGDDKELSLGFLYSEGVINSIHDVEDIKQVENNVIEVKLNKPIGIRIRELIVNSSCGVCGRAFLYTLNILKSDLKVKREVIFSFPEKLREKQSVFNISGGLHATALFNPQGELLFIYEDVGRHNAVDKVVGRLLLEDKIPASNYIMQVSGRLGYEIVSKGIKAGIPIICGISAPTSLAIEIAEEAGLTLIGFLRGKSLNIYTHSERIY